MRADLAASMPDVANYPVPGPVFGDEIGAGLYNSDRDYLEQIEAYKQFQGKLS